MILSVRYIKNPRVIRRCVFCRRDITENGVRVYEIAPCCGEAVSLHYHQLCRKLEGQGYDPDELEKDNPYNSGVENA